MLRRFLLAFLFALLATQACAQKTWIDDSGTWRQANKIWVNDSGTWRQAQKVWVNDSGTWRQVYSGNFTCANTVSVSTTDYNFTANGACAGWNGTDVIIATITINSGIVVGSSSTATAAFIVPSLPGGSSVTVTNNGYIEGHGGEGGIGNTGSGSTDGSAGGPALNIAYATTITNTFGVVGGGGGGGGGGGWDPGGPEYGGGGGGGQGYVGGAGGVGGDGCDGDAGTYAAAGLGCLQTGGYAGDGGGLGTAGAHAQPATVAGSAGGAAGACKIGAGAITVNGGSTYGSGC